MDLFKQIFRAGFFHVVGSGFINAGLTLALNVMIVRFMSVSDYGAYSYAYSIVSILVLFNALGAPAAALQICSELFKNKRASDDVFSYAYRSGFKVDIVFLILILLIGILFPLSIPGSGSVLLLYCCYPLFMFLNEAKLSYLRIWLMNKQYALLTNIKTILLVIGSIIGVLSFGVYGFVVGQNIALVASWIVSCVMFPFRGLQYARCLSAPQKKDYWKVALISALNNGLGGMLSLLGTILVGALLMESDLVAYYNAACTIPFGLLFLPTLVATFVNPYFVRHRNDRIWTIRSYGLAVFGGILVFGALAIFFIIFADQIMLLLYGADYLESSQSFRILMLGFWITSSARQLTGNLLVTQRKLLVNTCVGVVSIIVTCAASFFLIPSLGIQGAAWSYTITMLVGVVINVSCYVRTINRLPRIEGSA